VRRSDLTDRQESTVKQSQIVKSQQPIKSAPQPIDLRSPSGRRLPF
jgi:hypothetical protein